MSTLLTIEERFLSLPQVKQGLNLAEIKTAQRQLTNAQKKKFTQTISLSKLVVSAVDWLNSEEGKAVMNEEGLNWNTEQFGAKVFGWQKSFTYKMIKAGKLEDEVVDTFEQKCKEAEAEGKSPNRSLEGLLKFAKASGESDGEESGEAEGEAEVEVRIPTILTFTYKSPNGKNVSVRIDAEGNLTTTNETSEIIEAVNILVSQLQINN
jgi:hypothetical protein